MSILRTIFNPKEVTTVSRSIVVTFFWGERRHEKDGKEEENDKQSQTINMKKQQQHINSCGSVPPNEKEREKRDSWI